MPLPIADGDGNLPQRADPVLNSTCLPSVDVQFGRPPSDEPTSLETKENLVASSSKPQLAEFVVFVVYRTGHEKHRCNEGSCRLDCLEYH